MIDKQILRDTMKASMAAMTAAENERLSHEAALRLFESKTFQKAEVVMVYLSLPHELDTTDIVLRCWQNRKRVLAPKVSWSQGRMLPVEIHSMTDDLAISQQGIREPVKGVPFPINLIDLILVPGLAFDETGNRLGRGRGFYDRFLVHHELKAKFCGLAFEYQIVEEVPTNENDVRVHMLVTDAKTRKLTPA